jgi:branched-chain amino acid transport system substrate-binding protein
VRRRATPVLTALLLVMAACSGGEAGDTTTTQPTGTTSETAATTTAPGTDEPEGDPIVVGGTLPLTGAFGATGVIHRIAGDLFVERLNDAGGLLGRPVVWDLRDDESVTDNVATLYEQLISQVGVDLIVGPYATPNIQATMPIAERHGLMLPQHTAVLAPTLNYECQFPAWSIGYEPNVFIPNQLADAMESLGGAVETVAVVTNQSGSVAFVSYGRPDVDEPAALSIFPDRGFEVVADIPYPPGNTEWDAIATQIRAADPDLVMLNGLGVDANGLMQAMLALDGYLPPMMFALFPPPDRCSRSPRRMTTRSFPSRCSSPTSRCSPGSVPRRRRSSRSSPLSLRRKVSPTQCSRHRRPPLGTHGRS